MYQMFFFLSLSCPLGVNKAQTSTLTVLFFTKLDDAENRATFCETAAAGRLWTDHLNNTLLRSAITIKMPLSKALKDNTCLSSLQRKKTLADDHSLKVGIKLPKF